MNATQNTLIGIVADTHIPDEAKALPKQMLNDFKSVEMIIHLGDFSNLETLHALQRVKTVVGVFGNTDDIEIRNRFPQQRILEVHGYQLGLIHGWGPPEKIEQRVLTKLPQVDIALFGHSHVPFFEKIGETTVLNPGSPFLNRDGGGTYAILELGDTIQHRLIPAGK